MMRRLKNLKNNIIKTSNHNKYQPLTLNCNEALTTFYMNNLDLCADVLKTTDPSTRRFIISGLIKNLDMNNHQLSLLIAMYGEADSVIIMLDSPYKDVVFEAKSRLVNLEFDGIMTDMLNIIYK